MKKVSIFLAVLLLLLALTGCGAKQKDGIAADTGDESSGIADVNREQVNPEKALEAVRALLSDKPYFEDIEYELYEDRHVEGKEYIVVHSYTQQPISNDSGTAEYAYPNKTDSVLTKEFSEDGIVPSGGQSQMLSISHAHLKNAPVMILDEPSSALDPIAEYEMYQKMMEACIDKTVIFISHRMSSAVLADRIAYIENGRIIELGTHSELMKLGGKYAEMFLLQAQSYTEEDGE